MSNLSSPPKERSTSNKIFITHGKNKELLELLKKLLTYGGYEPIVSIEKESVSKPVPDKIMEDMRQCSGAVIHIDAEQKLLDSEANEHIVINPNVLIEIGAAMALFDKRFILVVKEGTKLPLPSNLQGLYEVRYTGDKLDGDTTLRLLEAFNSLKRTPLPSFH